MAGYIGRFAPSPTGPLHAGSLVAALASWLDARAHGGQWLVRIEDVDSTRCLLGLNGVILQQLAACGLVSDLPPVYQSRSLARYQQALDRLITRGCAYPCACSRKEVERVLQHNGQTKHRHGELVYPGTCREGLHGKAPRTHRFFSNFCASNDSSELVRQVSTAIDSKANCGLANAQVLPVSNVCLPWTDRRLGAQCQNVSAEVGDFILKRADGCFAYQLAVVADDGAQGITDVVRGADLADNTARQILLQQALSLPRPRYLHTPLVLGTDGDKLSKQNGAQALDTSDPLHVLNDAAQVLGLSAQLDTSTALTHWVAQWRDKWCLSIKIN